MVFSVSFAIDDDSGKYDPYKYAEHDGIYRNSDDGKLLHSML